MQGQTGRQTAAATTEQTSQSEQASVKPTNGNGSTDRQTSTTDEQTSTTDEQTSAADRQTSANVVGTTANGTQQYTGTTEAGSDLGAGSVAISAVGSVSVSEKPAAAAECPPSADAAGQHRPAGNGDSVGGGAVLSADSGEDGQTAAPQAGHTGADQSAPTRSGQNGTAATAAPTTGEDGAEQTASLAGDDTGEIQPRTAHHAAESDGQRAEQTTAASNDHQSPEETGDVQSTDTKNGPTSADADVVTSTEEADRVGLRSEGNRPLSGDTPEPPLEAGRGDRAVSAAEEAVQTDSGRSPASVRAVQAVVETQPEETARSPTGTEAGTEQPTAPTDTEAETEQPPGPETASGMTEVRSIWVVGSEENLPGAGTARTGPRYGPNRTQVRPKPGPGTRTWARLGPYLRRVWAVPGPG